MREGRELGLLGRELEDIADLVGELRGERCGVTHAVILKGRAGRGREDGTRRPGGRAPAGARRKTPRALPRPLATVPAMKRAHMTTTPESVPAR
ncbi:hypothetical protein GCM10018775_04020 [Streptomyces umbrinus]|nr:hypothetical protein GCM10018775_04020 [Streptomyces umbrinus]